MIYFQYLFEDINTCSAQSAGYLVLCLYLQFQCPQFSVKQVVTKICVVCLRIDVYRHIARLSLVGEGGTEDCEM